MVNRLARLINSDGSGASAGIVAPVSALNRSAASVDFCRSNRVLCVRPIHLKYIRDLVWRFYNALKAYKQNPSPRAGPAFRRRFDRIFSLRTGYEALDKLLERSFEERASY